LGHTSSHYCDIENNYKSEINSDILYIAEALQGMKIQIFIKKEEIRHA